MRVLVLHSAYLSGDASGENRTVEEEIRLLSEAGHSVHAFLPPRKAASSLGQFRESVSAVWSADASRQVKQLIAEHQPDVVHCHNLFPALSPAVLRSASATGSAVVQTLQNYRLLCLPATFLRDGRTCELCLGRTPWRGVVHGCYRRSIRGSAVLATSISWHRAIGSFDRVRLFLAASDFVRAKHVQAGFPADRIVVKPNFARATEPRQGPGDYFIYAGRLSAEKDVATLIRAAKRAGVRLVIAGSGPDEAELRRSATENVTLAGHVTPERVGDLLRGARALVLPALSYEGAPVSIVEAYAAGVPVIANEIGAVPEFVKPGESGLLVPPRDTDALVAALACLVSDEESLRLGSGALTTWQERYTPRVALRALEAAYEQALDQRVTRAHH